MEGEGSGLDNGGRSESVELLTMMGGLGGIAMDGEKV